MFSSSLKDTSILNTCTGFVLHSFNGKESDNEWSNVTGADLDFGARIYDSRVGRWLACDPFSFKYPGCSPYVGNNNCPISYIDNTGKGGIPYVVKNADGSYSVVLKMTVYVYTDNDCSNNNLDVTAKATSLKQELETNFNSENLSCRITYKKESSNDPDGYVVKTETLPVSLEVDVIPVSMAEAKALSEYNTNKNGQQIDKSWNFLYLDATTTNSVSGGGHTEGNSICFSSSFSTKWLLHEIFHTLNFWSGEKVDASHWNEDKDNGRLMFGNANNYWKQYAKLTQNDITVNSGLYDSNHNPIYYGINGGQALMNGKSFGNTESANKMWNKMTSYVKDANVICTGNSNVGQQQLQPDLHPVEPTSRGMDITNE